jgi:nucleoside-diphosphate kinase
MADESALLFLKPDAVVRRYVGARTLARLAETGLRVRRLATVRADRAFLAEQHYAIHKGRFFYEWLVDYVNSTPVIAVELHGPAAVSTVRGLLGATIPAEADPGSIRGRYGIDGGLNVAHASDSPENGQREIQMWSPLLEAGAEEPDAALQDYIARYLDGPMIDPLRYRELFAALAAGQRTRGQIEAAFRRLLTMESDHEEATVAALAAVMVASADVRKPEGG